MSPVTDAGIQSAPKNDTVESLKLSKRVVQEGINVLRPLQRVERALRTEDTGDAVTIDMVTKDVVRLEQANVDFSTYVRRNAGYEYPDQRKLVYALLVVCFEQHRNVEAKRPAIRGKRELLKTAG